MPGAERIRTASDLQLLYTVYGAGFVALAGLFTLLFRQAAATLISGGRALRATQAQNLADSHAVLAGAGTVSITLALTLPMTEPIIRRYLALPMH